ncbi:MAG TPA: response regulator [Bacteroidales bacterium]|nr:response regulator [Bacteroidales bacterium]
MTNNIRIQEELEELSEKIKILENSLAKNEKIRKVLMDRVERSIDSAGDSYSMFERNILLQQHVEKRTGELADVNKRLLAEIKERRQIEKDLEKSRNEANNANLAKSYFLANMSHEIRTPINAILGMADLLWDSPLSQEQKEYVQVFRSSGEHLLQLINDILDVSKVEAGRLVLENTYLDLYEVIEKTVEVMAMRAHAKGLELIYQITDDVPVHLKGDPFRLRQILVNLIGNAIKFTEKGDISLNIIKNKPGSNNPDKSDSMVDILFSVSDTGIGIEPEKQDFVFQSFSQAESSITRKYGGSGLGLTISKQLVELMGGRIWVESNPGRGSIFSFLIPFEVIVPPESRDINIPEMDMHGMKVIIIDDNKTNRMILNKTLTNWGADVSEAEDGWHGCAELKRAKAIGLPYDLVLLDGRMPGMSGFEVAEQLKDSPGLAGITIMMLTSDHRQGDPERAFELGIAQYLLKPVKRSDLQMAINNAMGRTKEKPMKVTISEEVDIQPDNRPLNILLVEDHENNRMVVQAYLKDTAYHLDIAENGKIACQKITSYNYDLVLMDMQMPIMDGYTATSWVRKWEKEQKKEPTPIIALTAHALVEDAQKCLDAGCAGYITKPVKKKKLLEAIIRYTSPYEKDNKFERINFGREVISQPDVPTKKGDRIIVHVDEAFKEFVPRFLEVTSKDIQTMGRAIEDEDFDTLQRLGHSMKGSGVSFGFDIMSNIGKSIEQAAKEKSINDIRICLSELSDYIGRVDVVFV